MKLDSLNVSIGVQKLLNLRLSKSANLRWNWKNQFATIQLETERGWPRRICRTPWKKDRSKPLCFFETGEEIVVPPPHLLNPRARAARPRPHPLPSWILPWPKLLEIAYSFRSMSFSMRFGASRVTPQPSKWPVAVGSPIHPQRKPHSYININILLPNLEISKCWQIWFVPCPHLEDQYTSLINPKPPGRGAQTMGNNPVWPSSTDMT